MRSSSIPGSCSIRILACSSIRNMPDFQKGKPVSSKKLTGFPKDFRMIKCSYSVIVCKMVNAVREQGNYWTANNIIWGLMLIPISALAEIIKKDCKDELSRAKMKHYHLVIITTFLIWLCFIPLLNPFLASVMGIKNSEAIKHILVILIPFYLAYNYTVLFDSILIGNGKTYYCFGISIIINLIYYPIMYKCISKGIFTPNITFICMMFGFGMILHLFCSIICFITYSYYNKK